MIQMQTILDVADNTGAKLVRCIKVPGGTHRRYASRGAVICASVHNYIAASEAKADTLVKVANLRVSISHGSGIGSGTDWKKCSVDIKIGIL